MTTRTVPPNRRAGSLSARLFYTISCLASSAVAFGQMAGPDPGGAEGAGVWLRSGYIPPPALRAADMPNASGAAWWIARLDGPLSVDRRAALAGTGAVLGDYVPVHAVYFKGEAAVAAAAERLPFVQWVRTVQPAMKLDPAIGRAAGAPGGRTVVIATMFAGEDSVKAVSGILGVPSARLLWVNDDPRGAVAAVEVESAHAPRLADLVEVQFLEHAPSIELRNENVRRLIMSNQSGFLPLYDWGLHGEGQVLGVLDSHVDALHCSFYDSPPIGLGHRKLLAYNVPLGAGPHGTHVACTAVGDGGGPASLRGVAYAARLVYNTVPSYNEADILTRLTLHHFQGARVHTNSWGDGTTSAYTSLTRGFDLFLHQNEDDVATVAVANIGMVTTPENAKNVLAVGATRTAPDQQDDHCSGARGPTPDERIKPDVMAPGCEVLSADANSGCGTRSSNGTSMATAGVAGAALLTRQYYTSGFYPRGIATANDAFVPTGALIRATMINACQDLTGVLGYPSNSEGWGRLVLDNTLCTTFSSRRMVVRDVRNAVGFTGPGSSQFPLTVSSPIERLKVTLVWTDPPAAAGAAIAIVNDLDLELVAPDGTLYRGNNFTWWGDSEPGGDGDRRNTVEQIHVPNPPAGVWVVRVRAAAVNQDRQGYAVVVSGRIVPEAASACPCDADSNGVVNSLDFFTFLQAFFAGNGDANRDGVTNSADFFFFFDCFFAGCP